MAEAPSSPTASHCEACGRPLRKGEGRLSRVMRGVVKTLCADCEQLMAPPTYVAGRGSPPFGSTSIATTGADADPQAATVELPPPTQQGTIDTPPPSGGSSELAPPPPTARKLNAHLRLALYVALAVLAGVVTGVLWMAIIESLS